MGEEGEEGKRGGGGGSRGGGGGDCYRQRHQVLGPSSLVEGRHAVFGPEVQVSSSVPQDLDDLHHVVQVSCERQRALCNNKHNVLLHDL